MSLVYILPGPTLLADAPYYGTTLDVQAIGRHNDGHDLA